MVMYSFEVAKRKKKKIVTVIIVVVTVALAILSAFGGVKLAQYMHEQKIIKAESENNQIENSQNANGQNQNEQQSAGTEGKNNEEVNRNEEPKDQNTNINTTSVNGLTTTQLSAISKIYSSKEKRAFLTFDDGPSSTVTPKILDILKKENIKATFFVLGTMVKSNPSILKRERSEGHYIANHGYSHVYKSIYKNKNGAIEEYQKTNDLIKQALEDSSYESRVFRFPGGSSGGYYDAIKKEAKKILKENMIAYIDWNCLTNDAAGATTKAQIMSNLKATANSNSLVILMHDAPNKKLTAETLTDVIKYLRGKGYKFYSIGDLIDA